VPKITLRQQRLTAALNELPSLTSELAFERVSIHVSDEGRHWQFLFGEKHIADYWPSSAKGQIVGQAKPTSCASPAQAQKLALAAKKAMFKRVASKMLPCENCTCRKGKENGS
jgi:hypothetical protein